MLLLVHSYLSVNMCYYKHPRATMCDNRRILGKLGMYTQTKMLHWHIYSFAHIVKCTCAHILVIFATINCNLDP